MAAERDLRRMLATLDATRTPGEYVFDVLAEGATAPADAIALMREAEGLTVVRPLRAGEPRPDFVAAWLTLTVHSDLAAVGLTAAFAGALAEDGIPCNVIAGYHHDHLFVPTARADEALAALARLRRGAGTET
jgi:hypothetical protein